MHSSINFCSILNQIGTKLWFHQNHKTRKHYFILVFFFIVSSLIFSSCKSGDQSGAVYVSTLNDTIGPVSANFIDRALDHAIEKNATAWVLQLDTPGGLMNATDKIVQRIESSTIPVVVFVSPLGAHAASAGTFITLAAHIAAMAPSTQIGAAHPINSDGTNLQDDVEVKVENDAVSDIRGIAQLRGRNAEWAESSIRDSASITAAEALKINVIDVIAKDLPDLLKQIDGWVVELHPGGSLAKIQSQNAPIAQTNMSIPEKILSFIANPNIAFILLSLGALALIVEIVTPGLIGPGIIGLIALILAFFGLGELDTNPAGIALLVLAIILVIAEISIAGFGFLGIGAIVSFVTGGLLLISSETGGGKISVWTLIGTTSVLTLGLISLWILVIKDRRQQTYVPPSGKRLLNQTGYVRSELNPIGSVIVNSEIWSARSEAPPIPKNSPIRVIAVDGLVLIVEPINETSSAYKNLKDL